MTKRVDKIVDHYDDKMVGGQRVKTKPTKKPKTKAKNKTKRRRA